MGRPAKFDLEEILNRATDLFWLHGCDAISTRDLERALDIRAPAIYRRFKSKEELLARCIEHYVDTVIAGRIEQKLERAEDPMRGLYRFFVSAIKPVGREAQLRGCLLANTAAHAESQSPAVRAALFRGWHMVDTAFRAQIERAKRAGQLDPNLDSGSVSQSLLISLQGLLTLSRVGVTDLRPGLDASFRSLGWPPEEAAASDNH